MTNLRPIVFTSRNSLRFMTLVSVLGIVAILAPLSRATAPELSLSVVNNSQVEIQHLYLAPAGTDNWGPDQLNSPIAPGHSRTLNVSWNQSTVKLVAEDNEGCFMSTTVGAEGSPTWTITGATARDCGD